MTKEYDLEKIRAQIRKKMGGAKDPSEFRAPKVEIGEEKHLRFFILPGFSEGDALFGGEASRSMDLFFVQSGSHYIENKVWGCPRSINDEHCELCDYAFNLMTEIGKDPKWSDEEKKKRKSDVAKNFLSSAYKMVNIYFPDGKLGSVNPEELRGTVKWFNASTTIFNLWWECLSRDDDGGDEIRPLPHGVFYNDEAAFLFDLRITKKGTMNSYEGSGFIVSDKIKTMPIAFQDGKPDRKKIAEILAKRHDLFTKIPDIDVKALSRITANLRGGTSSGSGGFDHDEERQQPPVKEDRAKPASRSVASEVPVDTKPAKPVAPPKNVEPVVEEPVKAPEGEDWDADVESLLAQIED